MRSDDQSWVAFLDPGFSVLELNSRRGRHYVQYLDVVTGWGGDVAQLGFREAAAAFDQAMAPDGSPGEAT